MKVTRDPPKLRQTCCWCSAEGAPCPCLAYRQAGGLCRAQPGLRAVLVTTPSRPAPPPRTFNTPPRPAIPITPPRPVPPRPAVFRHIGSTLDPDEYVVVSKKSRKALDYAVQEGKLIT